MSGWHLTLKQQPTLRLDLRELNPHKLGAMTAGDVAALPVWHGNESRPLGDFFDAAALDDDGLLRFEGDLRRCDRIGWQLHRGAIEIDGSVGDHLATGMNGGRLTLRGDAGLLAGCELSGGELTVHGNVGDFAASALPGNMEGMRGGVFVVHGKAGARFADRMRRGVAVVHGDVGDYLASRMVAGSIAVGGQVGAHPGYGMRRGSIVFAGATPARPATFVPIAAEFRVAWQLLARHVATHGGAFADLPRRAASRWVGDLAADGRGEWFTLAS